MKETEDVEGKPGDTGEEELKEGEFPKQRMLQILGKGSPVMAISMW